MNNIEILRGLEQIGGSIAKIESKKGTKIVIDFGRELEEQKGENKFQVEGINKGNPSYDAVFITHSHMDHIGLINEIDNSIPIYLDEVTKKLYELTCEYTEGKVDLTNKQIKILKQQNGVYESESINDGDIIVTPYLTDHSAYNSLMYVIKVDDEVILHTGDFRGHGYKNIDETLELIKENEGKITSLIIEGTCIGKGENECISEEQLGNMAKEVFKEYDEVFILQASTNVERIKTFVNAAGTSKNIIADLFTCEILDVTNKTYSNIKSYFPIKYERYARGNEKYKKMQELYNKKYSDIKYEQDGNSFVAFVKSSMDEDIKKLHQEGKKAVLIYSMSEYYKKTKSTSEFLNKINKMEFDQISLHTSGHADINTLKKVDAFFDYPKVHLIHTDYQEFGSEIFKNIVEVESGLPEDILRLYKESYFMTNRFFEKIGNNTFGNILLEKIYNKYDIEEKNIVSLVKKIILKDEKFPVRSEYRFAAKDRNKKFEEILVKRKFGDKNEVEKGEFIKPEHAIEYHLIGKKEEALGEFFGYEVPFAQTRNSGAIDLISYNNRKSSFN